VSAELAITGYTSGDEPKPFTVGQITAMVIAVTTTLRATWLFIRRFDLLPRENRPWSERSVEMEGVAARGAGGGRSGGAVEPPGEGARGREESLSEYEQEKGVGPQPSESDVNVVAGR